MKINYLCDRCGFNTNLRGNFKRHINRKRACIAIKNNISVEEIKEKYGFQKNDFPNALKFYEREISLPIYTKLELETQEYVITTLKKTFEGRVNNE